MTKPMPGGGQTPWEGLKPKPPKDFAEWPFWYASLQCNWVWFYADLDAAAPFAEGTKDAPTGLRVARFPVAEGKRTVDKAAIVLNFQRYTAHYSNALGTTNEVEFNLVCYPASRSPDVPYMPLANYIAGDDQTGTLGHLRLHVAADNAIAVKAGREVFGEPKFVGQFVYDVPTLNGPPSDLWKVRLVDPEDADEFVYDMTADLSGLSFAARNATPVTEFATGLGRTVRTRWTIFGQFLTAMLGEDEARRVKLKIGANEFRMTKDMRALFGRKPRCVAAQTFVSLPACAEPEGVYLDAAD